MTHKFCSSILYFDVSEILYFNGITFWWFRNFV